MKKTNRTNKTGLNVKWPSGIFTIKQCMKDNEDFVKITLRVRIKNAINDGTVTELGHLKIGKGRPSLVLVHGPVTQDHIAEAKSKSVVLKDNLTVDLSAAKPVQATPSVPTESATEQPSETAETATIAQ